MGVGDVGPQRFEEIGYDAVVGSVESGRVPVGDGILHVVDNKFIPRHFMHWT